MTKPSVHVALLTRCREPLLAVCISPQHSKHDPKAQDVLDGVVLAAGTGLWLRFIVLCLSTKQAHMYKSCQIVQSKHKDTQSHAVDPSQLPI